MLQLGIATLVISTAVTLLVTPAVVRLARVIGALDMPGLRKMHSTPIPRIGGVAVFAGFIAGLVYAAWVSGKLFTVPSSGMVWRGLALATTGMFAVGLWDDVRELSFRTKLASQIVAALLVWYFGFRIEVVSHPLGGAIELGPWALPVTILWIVAITNAVNLLDGLDGLAAGTAVIMTSAIAVIAFVRDDLGVTAVGVALVGSLIGFLWFNFNPAKVFLGDSGTMFIGFILAVSCVSGGQKGSAVVAIFVPLLVLGLPLLDTGFAIVRRLLRLGSNSLRAERKLLYLVRNLDHVFLPDRGHIHHRLLDLGLSHRGAVLALYGVALLTAAAAFALVLLKSRLLALVLVAALAVLLLAFFLLLRQQARLVARGEPASGERVPVAPVARRDDLGQTSET